MNQKIDEIGKKLNLEPSGISEKRSKKGKHRVFWGMHAINVILAGIFGLVFGFVEYRTQRSTYPYASTQIGNRHILGMNLATGIGTLPAYKFTSKITRFKRAGIFIGNVALSVLVYWLFTNMFQVFPTVMNFSDPAQNGDDLGVGVLYGVYTDECRLVSDRWNDKMYEN